MSLDSWVRGSISQDGGDDGSLAIFGLDNYSGARNTNSVALPLMLMTEYFIC